MLLNELTDYEQDLIKERIKYLRQTLPLNKSTDNHLLNLYSTKPKIDCDETYCGLRSEVCDLITVPALNLTMCFECWQNFLAKFDTTRYEGE